MASSLEDTTQNPRHEKKQKGIEDILRAISSGYDSIAGIARTTGLSVTTLRKYASEAGIELPKRTKYLRRMGSEEKIKIEDMAGHGATLKEMGDAVASITPGGIWQYINRRRKVHRIWMRGKKTAKRDRKELGKQLIYTLKAREYDLFQKEPWASQKAIEYIIITITSPKQPTKYPYETLFTFFERYERARNNGEKLSLEELCNNLGMPAQTAGTILRRVGLEPLYGARYVHITPKEKVEAIQRGYGLEMSAWDIAYFLGLPKHVVKDYFSKAGNFPERRADSKTYLANLHRKILTWRLASQIYEAHDAGFEEDEIVQLFGTNKKIVSHTVNNKDAYGQQIVEALRVLLNDTGINNPYLPKNYFSQPTRS